MKKLLTFILIVTVTIVTYSQPPQKVSYQAVVRNSSGQLVTNHPVGMRISILQGTPSGTVVYQEIYNPNPETNGNGLVSVDIGGGIPISGTFSAINWSGGPYFLKAETDPSGGTSYTIVGTSQFLSVPYALQANEKDPVFGASAAKGITSGNITNWNTAYGWGNHSGLYRPISYVPAWSEITSKPTTVSGYGITDAVTLTGNQTISGIKTFISDIIVNGTTVGKGKNSVASNTAVGYQALNSNFTTGFGNTAFGCRALYWNMTGRLNTAFGDSALYTNSAGYGNTASGYKALYSNLGGVLNTAIGALTLQKNVAGGDNTAIGNAALLNNDSGSENTACGRASLLNNTTGNYNTATGYGALAMSKTPSYNTANGGEAGYNCLNGSFNTATGYRALKGDIYTGAGHHNTAVGNEALTSIAGGHNNTSTGSISLQAMTTGSGNTANGYSALNFTTTGSHNTGIGVNAGNVNTTGSDNTCIGYFSNVGSNNLTNATAIGSNAIVNANNKIVLGNASATTVGGYGNWTNYSDSRLKENISYKNDLGLNFISRLRTVEFNYREDENKRRRDGLIAQDVQKVLNDLNLHFSGLVVDDDKDRTLNLSYGDFVIPLINAVQEQQKLIEDQQKQINELKLALGLINGSN